MINILVRTSNRPKCFADCIASIESQTYQDYRLIVGSDTREYYPMPYHPIRYQRELSNGQFIQLRESKARHFPFNLYLNELMRHCKDGYVLFLDDDDEFTSTDSLGIIAKELQNPVDAAFWRVRICENIFPSDKNFGQRPVVKDISGIGLAFHTDYIPMLQFDPYKQADYRLADRIYSLLNVHWIDEVLTQTQRRSDNGPRYRKDK